MDSCIKPFYFLLFVLCLVHNSKNDDQIPEISTEIEVAEAESYFDEEPRRLGSWRKVGMLNPLHFS